MAILYYFRKFVKVTRQYYQDVLWVLFIGQLGDLFKCFRHKATSLGEAA